MLADMKLTEYLDELASSSSVPGVGSAAALMGANAAALVSMVCNLTIGKKGYEDVADEIGELLVESEKLRHEFVKLVDLDAQAFAEVMDAYKLPKTTEEEKHIRQGAIQAATRKATQVPLRTIELAVELLSLAREAGEYGNKNVISDAGVAATLGVAAMEAAWLNVQINLNPIVDERFKEEILDRGEALLDEGEELYEDAISIVESKIA